MAENRGQRTGGLFDLRYIIALLFAIYGVVLTILGAIGNSPDDDAKTGGININLWVGIIMLVVAGLFTLWATLRPTIIEATMTSADMLAEQPGGEQAPTPPRH